MTPEQRSARAVEMLDAWLVEFDKLDDPIETALCDLSGFTEELQGVINDECGHGKDKCWDCVASNAHAVLELAERLRDLWEARA